MRQFGRRRHGGLDDEDLQPTPQLKGPPPPAGAPRPQPAGDVTLVEAILEHAAAVRDLARAVREVKIDETITVKFEQASD